MSRTGQRDPTMTTFLLAPSFASLVALASIQPVSAQVAIPDALQQEAMTCVGEAAQICPDVWTAADHGVACMIGKRQGFSPRCRVIYDKVARALKVR